MKQNPSWEANSSSAGQEIAHILWNSKLHCPVHINPPWATSYIYSVHVLPLHFFKIYFSTVLPSMSRSSKWSLPFMHFSPHPSHRLITDGPPTWWLDMGLTNSHHKISKCYEISRGASDPCDQYMYKQIYHLNKTGNVCKTKKCGAFVQPFLQWKIIKYYILWVCVRVALGIQHAMRMRHIVIYGMSSSKYFPHYLINGTIFGKKKSYLT